MRLLTQLRRNRVKMFIKLRRATTAQSREPDVRRKPLYISEIDRLTRNLRRMDETIAWVERHAFDEEVCS